MKRIFRQETLIAEGRFFWASVLVVGVTAMLLLRVWFVQIYRGEHYRQIAEKNRVRRIEIPAPRGMIYDTNGKLILGNRPFFDLVLIPQYAREQEKTFSILSRLLHIPEEQFERRIKQSAGRPKFLPVSLKRNLTLHEVSTIESNKIFLPGIEIVMAPRRDYKASTPSHLVGYLGEIDPKNLSLWNRENPNNPYLPGDLVGKQGLEARWEQSLRGKRGFRKIQVDAFGRQTDTAANDRLLMVETPAIPGADLELTIDSELQAAIVQAFRGKNGAVVAMNPSTGEILAMLSEPGFDPTIYQDGISVETWRALTQHPFTPLLDKTTGGEFAPGSVYKAVVALAALQEGVVNARTTHHCRGSFTLGNRVYGCWEKKGHGTVDLRAALVKSCDVYFYQVGVELGVERIAKYARDLGLGQRLGVQVNMERPGIVPTADWKMQLFKAPWSLGDTPSISIGQGFNLITPVQMANLYATIANGGLIWQPRIIKRIVSPLGEIIRTEEAKSLQKSTIKSEYFAMIRQMLQDVVMSPEGTGKRAAVPGHTIAGKTGSVQVVSLKRNNNKVANVSMKWKEHAVFAAFSPVENAEIAIAVISENDRVGGGGLSAGPVAGEIISRYYEIKEQRKIKLAQKKSLLTIPDVNSQEERR